MANKETAEPTEAEEQPVNLFAAAENEDALLHQLAGFASVCWEDAPRSEFDSTRAHEGVVHALERLHQIRTAGDVPANAPTEGE